MSEQLHFRDILTYEIFSSRLTWFAAGIPSKWFRDKIADYFVWKTMRKVRRYDKRIKRMKKFELMEEIYGHQ